MTAEHLSVWIASGSLLVNIAFLGFLVVQVRLLKRQLDQANEATDAERLRVQKQATLEFMANTLQRRQELAAEMPSETDTKQVEHFLELLRTDPKKLRHVYNYLNYYEHFAVGVNSGVFNIDVVERASATVIIRIDDTYRPFVNRIKAEENHPFMYDEIARLAATLRVRRGLRLASLPQQTPPGDGAVLGTRPERAEAQVG
ncbi:DUF4760 domain-containing protein [Catellatospora paridis]|uniref:DUF4760 domain-containing protein n=1 Tax=Catellatospora paridis TaxID=1617086 RepID=UPI0018B00FA7|nr:DUF4760 domain-containing protein [Catellatospora paridis]